MFLKKFTLMCLTMLSGHVYSADRPVIIGGPAFAIGPIEFVRGADGVEYALPPQVKFVLQAPAGITVYEVRGLEAAMAVIEDARGEKICGNCAKATKDSMPRCAGCKVAHFCNTDCHKARWSFHKGFCLEKQAELRK